MKKSKLFRTVSALLVLVLVFSSSTIVLAADINADSTVSLISLVEKDEELLSYYHEYLATLPEGYSDAAALTPENTEAFIQYAVDQGMINDTLAERGVITKAIVRAEFKVVVLGGQVAGFTTAADFLDHSLQDNPSMLTYAYGSSISNQILNSAEGREIVEEFKSCVKDTNYTSCNTNGTIALDSTTDLHLAYNNVYYNVQGFKTDGQWTIQIIVNDLYDFDEQPWKNAMTDNIVVTALNNYAAYAESIGAIVPYAIHVFIRTSFTV